MNWKILFNSPWEPAWNEYVWDGWRYHNRWPFEGWYYLHWLWRDKEKREHVWWVGWTMLPLVWTALAFVLLLIFNVRLEQVPPQGNEIPVFAPWSEARILLPLYLTLGIWLVTSALALVSDFIRMIKARMDIANEAEREQREKEARKKAAQDYAERFFSEEFRPVFCEQGNLAADLGALPEEKRTIRLKFWNLKAKVCRPYSL